MVKHPLAVLLLVLFAVSSCKKEEPLLVNGTGITIRPPRPMVQTINTTDYQGKHHWEHYYYDSLWRIARLDRYTDYYHRIDTTNYVYDSLNRGVAINNDWHSLSNGLVNSRIWYNETYTYNSNTNMLSKTMLHGYISYSYNADYNLVFSHMNGEYGSDRTNADDSFFYSPNINTIGNYNKGLYMWGKSSVNLPDYAYNHDYLSSQGSSGGNFNFTLYSYQYNDSGWVSHQQVKNSSIVKIYTDSVNYTLDTTYYIYNYDYTYY